MSSSSAFKVYRKKPEVIKPSKPTPHEFKPLSDLDDQKFLRRQMPGIQLCPYDAEMEGKDIIKISKQAVADALVYYYPLAGRLREGDNGKLTVECTGEGIIFIEANADITLDELLRFGIPPLPQANEFIHDVPESAGILHCPLLLLQLTRLKCGGLVSGSRVNHTMCDSAGLFQFLTAVGEIALGAKAPSIIPR